MVYHVNYDGTLWHSHDQKFQSDLAAVQYLTELRGCEGRIERTSKDRIEVHFDGVSRFSSLAG
jgi:hypothetical protein